jgi:hypothetical protein
MTAVCREEWVADGKVDVNVSLLLTEGNRNCHETLALPLGLDPQQRRQRCAATLADHRRVGMDTLHTIAPVA